MKLSMNGWVVVYIAGRFYDYLTTFLFVNWNTGQEGNALVLSLGWTWAIVINILISIVTVFILSNKKVPVLFKIANFSFIPLVVIFNTGAAIDALRIIFSK